MSILLISTSLNRKGTFIRRSSKNAYLKAKLTREHKKATSMLILRYNELVDMLNENKAQIHHLDKTQVQLNLTMPFYEQMVKNSAFMDGAISSFQYRIQHNNLSLAEILSMAKAMRDFTNFCLKKSEQLRAEMAAFENELNVA